MQKPRRPVPRKEYSEYAANAPYRFQMQKHLVKSQFITSCMILASNFLDLPAPSTRILRATDRSAFQTQMDYRAAFSVFDQAVCLIFCSCVLSASKKNEVGRTHHNSSLNLHQNSSLNLHQRWRIDMPVRIFLPFITRNPKV
ncbi:unnamed protein product [Victoria cruziana]